MHRAGCVAPLSSALVTNNSRCEAVRSNTHQHVAGVTVSHPPRRIHRPLGAAVLNVSMSGDRRRVADARATADDGTVGAARLQPGLRPGCRSTNWSGEESPNAID